MSNKALNGIVQVALKHPAGSQQFAFGHHSKWNFNKTSMKWQVDFSFDWYSIFTAMVITLTEDGNEIDGSCTSLDTKDTVQTT